jgi:hypothetical protein
VLQLALLVGALLGGAGFCARTGDEEFFDAFESHHKLCEQELDGGVVDLGPDPRRKPARLGVQWKVDGGYCERVCFWTDGDHATSPRQGGKLSV